MLPSPRMHHLPDFPSEELVLQLEPEELAPHVLRLAKSLVQNGIVHRAAIAQTVTSPPSFPPSPPLKNRTGVEMALAEAIQWLAIHIMLVTDPGMNGTNGFLCLTRRGEEALDERKFEAYRRGVAFPKSLLHASIADKTWLSLARGEFDEAVFYAFRRVEEEVRRAAGFDSTDHGVSMLRRAFNPKSGPLTNQADEEGERDAMMHLFAGAFGACKNPRSHRSTQLEAQEAQEMVMLASHLLRIVDARKV